MSDINLEDVLIAEGVDYKTSAGNRGQQLILRECPVCSDERWKCYFGADSGLGNCFSCGKTFNLWSYVGSLLASQTRPSDPRSIGRYLDDTRRRLGYRPRARVTAKPVVETTSKIELPTSAPMPFEDGWVHPYLLSRGINGRYAKMFHLRFCASGWNRYVDDRGETKEQNFGGRILIPVFDLNGEMVTYQGRDATGAAQDRYKFAGGLPGTGRYILNGHVARAQKASVGLAVEGPFDVIGAQKAIDSSPDLSGIVPLGTFGKHFSVQKDGVDQMTALRQLRQAGMNELIFMWDGEAEAFNAALDACLKVVKIGMKPSIATLPAGMDPGEADARIICDAIRARTEVNRMTSLKLRMKNPYVAT